MALQADHTIRNTSHTELVTLFNIIKSLDQSRHYRIIIMDDAPIRSIKANNYLFFIYHIISDHTGYHMTEVHSIMKYMFNMELFFTPEFAIEEGGSTTLLKSHEFNWYVLQVRNWANNFLDMTHPIPDADGLTQEQRIAMHYSVPKNN